MKTSCKIKRKGVGWIVEQNKIVLHYGSTREDCIKYAYDHDLKVKVIIYRDTEGTE